MGSAGGLDHLRPLCTLGNNWAKGFLRAPGPASEMASGREPGCCVRSHCCHQNINTSEKYRDEKRIGFVQTTWGDTAFGKQVKGCSA